MYKKYFKRLFDVLLSGMALIILSPCYLVLYIVSLVKIGSPGFFHQMRCTKYGKEFQLYKFRTMSNERDDNGNLLSDDKRLVPFGRFLRNTSLDELPEIWNIFIGDMSIIGPRPFTSHTNKYLTDFEKNRFKVRGGLLPPEILYNNPTPTWDEQLKWEAEYANNYNFATDMKLFLRALGLVYKRGQSEYGTYIRKDISKERI